MPEKILDGTSLRNHRLDKRLPAPLSGNGGFGRIGVLAVKADREPDPYGSFGKPCASAPGVPVPDGIHGGAPRLHASPAHGLFHVPPECGAVDLLVSGTCGGGMVLYSDL